MLSVNIDRRWTRSQCRLAVYCWFWLVIQSLKVQHILPLHISYVTNSLLITVNFTTSITWFKSHLKICQSSHFWTLVVYIHAKFIIGSLSYWVLLTIQNGSCPQSLLFGNAGQHTKCSWWQILSQNSHFWELTPKHYFYHRDHKMYFLGQKHTNQAYTHCTWSNGTTRTHCKEYIINKHRVQQNSDTLGVCQAQPCIPISNKSDVGWSPGLVS